MVNKRTWGFNEMTKIIKIFWKISFISIWFKLLRSQKLKNVIRIKFTSSLSYIHYFFNGNIRKYNLNQDNFFDYVVRGIVKN